MKIDIYDEKFSAPLARQSKSIQLYLQRGLSVGLPLVFGDFRGLSNVLGQSRYGCIEISALGDSRVSILASGA